jgi:hypothetical protein
MLLNLLTKSNPWLPDPAPALTELNFTEMIKQP